MEYYKFLDLLHSIVRPKLYVEIGIREGESLSLASSNTKTIGIDPAHDIKFPISPHTRLFKETSDVFFENKDTASLVQNFDLAFIDGMHLSEFVLRDFINLEARAHKKSLIVLHDTLPSEEIHQRRERGTQIWTGDSWKVVPALQKWRPDLYIQTFDIGPTGLTIVSNLNSKSMHLLDSYTEICQWMLDLLYTKKETLIQFHAAEEFQAKVAPFKPERANVTQKTSKKNLLTTLTSLFKRKKTPACLGVLMCYNDGDILPESIEYLLSQNHALVVWDHGSTDHTADILSQYKNHFVEYKTIPREFDFYHMYPAMSKNLIENYVRQFDWISWGDQDEFLEGPTREKSYFEWVCEVYNSQYDWVRFINCNFWFTDKDDIDEPKATKRLRYYAPVLKCAPRIRAWRASSTNIREFNHNPPHGIQYPDLFCLRHYSMRSLEHAIKRISIDRVGIKRGLSNVHYDNMNNALQKSIDLLKIKTEDLYFDDGISDLKSVEKFDFHELYNFAN